MGRKMISKKKAQQLMLFYFFTSAGRQSPVDLHETEASLASIENTKPARAG